MNYNPKVHLIKDFTAPVDGLFQVSINGEIVRVNLKAGQKLSEVLDNNIKQIMGLKEILE